jgi:hypothetical protein
VSFEANNQSKETDMNMTEQNTTGKERMIKPGITFLPFGIYLLINGIGRAGWVWEGYTSWQPFSAMVIVFIAILIAIPIYRKYNVSFFSSPKPDRKSIGNVILIAIVLIGLTIVSVSTRELTLMIDPLSLYIGLAVSAAIIFNFGFDLPLVSLSFIFLAAMLLPSLDQQVIGSNHLNENMLEPFAYDLSMGLYFTCWGMLSVFRSKQMISSEPAVSMASSPD